MLLRDRDQCKFLLGSVHILSVLVLVSGSVNEPQNRLEYQCA